MKVMISLSKEARTRGDNPNAKGFGMGYMGSKFLAEAFVNRGHDLTIIHPDDVFVSDNQVFAKESFKIQGGQFFKNRSNLFLEGNVFFVYGLGEETSVKCSIDFINSLSFLENQFDFVLNSAESTSYEYKPNQKKLNLPWIPEFKVKTKRDLAFLVKSGEKIICKPQIGLCSQGIVFVDKEENIKKIRNISGYFFEKYIPSTEERRYIFLDNQLIIKRSLTKEGSPGKERCTNVDLIEGNPKEIEIARKAISLTKMFYGAVDFRGEYLLEINGSGTGVAPPTVSKELDSYNLSDPVVQAVERKLKRKH